MHARCAQYPDFYGPGGTLTHLGDQFWPAALSGKTARVLIDSDAVHTYHYIPDVARGLAMLGCAEAEVYGRPWMLPCAQPGTLRELVGRLSRTLGRDLKLATVPRWMVSGLGLFVGIVREVGEMSYQWEEPFVIDDSRYRAQFGQEPTAIDSAAAATVRWATDHYG